MPQPKNNAFGAGIVLHHLVALILFFVALYFTTLFLTQNQFLWSDLSTGHRRLGGVFRALTKVFTPAGSMDLRALAWSLGTVCVISLLGWFLIECVEVYMPLPVIGALSFLSGIGLTGCVFEWIAIAGHLTRSAIFVSCGFLLLILWPFAAMASHRRPEVWGIGEGGPVEQALRRKMANEQFSRSLIWPRNWMESLFMTVGLATVTLITILIFYHALLFPETYWDSLILYLGYARMMYQEHGIVEKVVGQVGIGLGANYPHLYSLIGAAGSLVMREWSEIPQRLIAPIAGLASTVLVYHTVLRLTRHVNFSVAITLLYRSIPMGIIYDQYASDYALSILFAAAFVYLAMMYIETALRGYFILATALIAFSMHLNYLMGILWIPWGGMLIAAHLGAPRAEQEEEAVRLERELRATGGPPAVAGWENIMEEEPAWTHRFTRPGLLAFLKTPTFYLTLLACGIVGSTWYLRNWIVTGNPVYAFFDSIFHGFHVNREVMKSAEQEWLSHGDGIGAFRRMVDGRSRNLWNFFVDWKLAWKLEPFFAGFALPGGIVLLARAIASLFTKHTIKDPLGGKFELRGIDPGVRVGWVALLLVLSLFGFHYLLAPFYLYQIVMILPVLAAVSSFSLPYWRLRGWRSLFGAVVLLIGIVPGVAMSLMGFKLLQPVPVGGGKVETPIDLFAFRHPLPDTATFYHWQYGEDATMWDYINTHLKREKILTHENRHLVFDPSIELFQLDDWAMQFIWPFDPREKVQNLKNLKINYYLYVPNEKNHPINARMGTEEWVRLGLVDLVFKAGENRLYKFK